MKKLKSYLVFVFCCYAALLTLDYFKVSEDARFYGSLSVLIAVVFLLFFGAFLLYSLYSVKNSDRK